jgi:BirA family biotin operon repressor/biotin-[acetyl-CoA-carboxylase] ligase
MRLVKLDAIDSTNNFLKGLASKESLENFTTIWAQSQTHGRGQMGSMWVSEAGKNLTMSVLIRNSVTNLSQIFTLNVAVAIAVIQALEVLEIPNLTIKWPNDIMSGNRKVGGILIENIVKSGGITDSVVGVGLNVNQTNFDNLPNASSLKLICKRDFDNENLLISVVEQLEETTLDLIATSDLLWQRYRSKLYKFGIPMPFENVLGKQFMGIIQGVTAEGEIQILLEDDSVGTFKMKQIKMLY